MSIVIDSSAGLGTEDITLGLPGLSRSLSNKFLALSAGKLFPFLLVSIPAGSGTKEVPSILDGFIVPAIGFYQQLAAFSTVNAFHH